MRHLRANKQGYIRLWQLLLVLLLGLSVACGPLSPQTQNSPLPALTQEVRPAYTGPVRVAFDTSLMSPVLASYGYRKTQPAHKSVFSTERDFRLQALPEGPVVFQETFVQGSELLEISREISISDTSKAYTLHLHNGNAQGEDQVATATVRLNGYAWIQAAEFADLPVLELEKTDIVLEASSTLQLHLTGEPGTQVTVTLVEAGSAGIIRRAHSGHITPSEPLFDPDDPASLGALEPFVQIPVSEDGRSLPTFSLNGGVPATISGGELLLKIRPPVQQNLNQILQRYQGRVVDEISSDEFQIMVNLERASLKSLPANLRALNALVDGNAAIESVAFDSLQGARMLAVMVELLLAGRQGELIEALDVNPVLFNNIAGSFEGVANHQSMNAQNSWWLTQTGVLQAWDRSMGFQRVNNRPVRVAVVDSSFKFMNQAMQAGQDLQGQILTTRMAAVEYNENAFLPGAQTQAYFSRVLSSEGQSKFFDDLPEAKTAHGTSQASTIASNINDDVGVAGVAPHAKIIPIKIGSFRPTLHNTPKYLASVSWDIAMGWDLRVALQAAGTLKADIVSITNSAVISDIENWLIQLNNVTSNLPYGWLSALQFQVDALALPPGTMPQSNHTICLFNAGNMGNHVRNTLPAGHLKNIVIVGAVSESLSSVPPFQRALFHGDMTEFSLFSLQGGGGTNLDGNSEAASAWWTGGGSPESPGIPYVSSQILNWEATLGMQNLKIWAPGSAMGAVGTPSSGPFEGQFIVRYDWGGTSAATPFTAGTLALFKSLKPDATVSDLISGSWVKFKTVQSTDNLLKDFYADVQRRKGIRLSPFALNVPVIDVAATLANAQLNTPANQLKEFVGTLRRGENNRPYLETANQTYDLAQFVEEEAFHTSSSMSQDGRLKALSQQLRQAHYQVFWNTVAINISSQKVRNTNLENSLVRIKGWSYDVPSDSAYPHKIEVADVIQQTTENAVFTIQSQPPDPHSLPFENYVYDKTGNRWLIPGQTLTVHSHEFVGLHFNDPIQSLEVKIGPVNVPIIDILENLAVIGIPDDLPAGVHDAVVKASGQTLTLEQVIQKASETLNPYIEPPHVPPSNDPGQNKTLRLFNISGSDEARAYLNDQLIATATADEDKTIELGPNGAYPLRTDQRNELRLELHSQSPGHTYGFELRADWYTVFRDIQGDAASGQFVRTPEGDIDPRTGQIYTERLWLHNSAILPVGAGDMWVKVYNLGDDEEVLLQTHNEVGDIQWQNDQFLVQAQYQTFTRKLPWHNNVCQPGATCWCRADLNNFCWTDNQLYAELFNESGNYSYAIEVYKGIYMIYRNRDGQPNGWGADQNSTSVSAPWSVWSGSARFWKYGEHHFAN